MGGRDGVNLSMGEECAFIEKEGMDSSPLRIKLTLPTAQGQQLCVLLALPHLSAQQPFLLQRPQPQ